MRGEALHAIRRYARAGERFCRRSWMGVSVSSIHGQPVHAHVYDFAANDSLLHSAYSIVGEKTSRTWSRCWLRQSPLWSC